MKYLALDMNKFNVFFLATICCSSLLFAQEKREREVRIKPNAFPDVAIKMIENYLTDAKRIRLYQEFDGQKKSFEAKFKRDRLFYSVEFDSVGQLEDVEFIISKNDIPEETWTLIQNSLDQKFDKAKIKKIQQHYPNTNEQQSVRLREAFQNLLLPYIKYEIIVSAKEDKGFREFEVTYDAEGNFLSSRLSIPQKYDHILY